MQYNVHNAQCIHTCNTYMRAFFSLQGEYICVSTSTHTHTHLLPKVSINLTVCCWQWSTLTAQTHRPSLVSFFPFCLFILPSYLTSTLTFFLFICLSPSCPCCSSTVMRCQWVTLKRLLYFYLTVPRQRGAAFSMTQLKRNYEMGNNHRSDTIAFMWWFYVH